MKLNKSVEQGIYVILILALQKDHLPLKSQLLSQRLKVSDSYLKKVLRKLVVAGLVNSSANKDGGYTLKRPVTEISLYDISQAVDNVGTLQLPELHLAKQVFPGDDAHIQRSEALAHTTFQKAQEDFNTVLKKALVSSLLEPSSYENGKIDWRETDF
ncbi:Rrf2 family transcriptional regulator [Pediococcus ethanolidurans]|uniref:Transcriptional regulator, BadM/Rrf2 family n=1 Tax=Pediococcus ethanolidurans TaxID=319653 RepID=A0A0R2K1E1_9LACO|nr:Rrf2 family transcriptional regulator [Pediococcus ethanolidurans]KRN83425.1 hypothetical protein IV87_GL000856 [Pediococcus ethanolidurans]GEN94473.1 transcriptional regulator [Pediococcus ethanolidurans]SER23815.1 transcriptional regulator, BadM/Rrf2 family [Pediococcus ethanolidurans]